MGGTTKKSAVLEKAELEQRLRLAKARRDEQEADQLLQRLASIDEVSYKVAAPTERMKQSAPNTPKPVPQTARRPIKTKVLVDDEIDKQFDLNVVIKGKKSSKLESIIQDYCTYQIEE